ncbi:hypothetical protein [uncultured Bacteroides sp.]|uniref:hypothetical protein n=1 Tax=uncultured Bacteroides sp. TaxID=162156 RepID=UPI0025EC1716|nr:hypothetical protein [uncultured Bacteroides sp.]
MTGELLIEEIITKECERYELEKSGFIANRHAAIEELLVAHDEFLPAVCSPEEFADRKRRLLDEWYSQQGFSAFFCRQAEKGKMAGMVKRLMMNALSHIRRKQTEATVDDELKLEEGRTVAFKLSSGLFAELYPELCRNGRMYASPCRLEEACICRIRAMFPLDYLLLYKRLCVRDSEFWEEIWRVLHRFVRFLVVEKKRADDEETVKEVCMETILSVQEQLDKGRLAPIASASHLLHSLHMTGRNKFREWLRAEEKKQEETLAEEDHMCWQNGQYEDMIVMDRSMSGHFDYLLETDEKNEYELCCALADVLNYGDGEVYHSLVEGMQETVQAITMLYVENKRYEEIALILYGKADSKQLANLRKLVSRGKEYLKKRMANLIVDYKRKGAVPLVAGEE